jgi:hypothetical protein
VPITTLIGTEDVRKSGRCITRFAVGKLKMRVMPVTIRPCADAGLNCNAKWLKSSTVLFFSLFFSSINDIIAGKGESGLEKTTATPVSSMHAGTFPSGFLPACENRKKMSEV